MLDRLGKQGFAIAKSVTRSPHMVVSRVREPLSEAKPLVKGI